MAETQSIFDQVYSESGHPHLMAALARPIEYQYATGARVSCDAIVHKIADGELSELQFPGFIGELGPKGVFIEVLKVDVAAIDKTGDRVMVGTDWYRIVEVLRETTSSWRLYGAPI